MTAAFRGPIRLAALPDLKSLIACIDAAFQPLAERIGKPPAPMLADYPDLVARGRVHLLEAEGRIAGVLVSEVTADEVFVETLAIDPSLQRLGAGRRLMGFVEDEARRAGCPRVRLYTHALMDEARHFYQALGYREVEQRREAGYDRVYLDKTLDPPH